jgi:hypothetical protein
VIVHLTSTTKIVELETATGVVPARVWEGHSDDGVEVIAFITRIAVHQAQDMSRFEAELAEVAPPKFAGVQAWPARMLID